MRPRFAHLLYFAIALAGLPAAAQADTDLSRVDLSAERAAIEAYQDFDQKLQDVGWKLVRGNAEFCERAIPSIGLQLQDMASYGLPAIARAALGLTGDFAVQTAARGSPAAMSGAFPANREIVRLERFDPNGWEAGKKLYWQRLTRAHNHIDAMLTEHGGIEIAFADGETARVRPVDVCASRFELMGSGDRAVATGDRVVIGIEFPAFAYAEPVFAGVVAHELAHNLLGHSAWLDRNGRGRRNVRLTEREADRLMPWLLANAGYDPRAAAQFIETYRPTSGSILFIPGTHQKWRDRAELVEGEIAQIELLLERTGKADWRTHFRREIDPRRGRED